MNKILKYGYVFSLIGLFFLIAHSIAPHNHDQQNTDYSFIEKIDNPITELLYSILTTELNIHHLEDIRTSNYISLSVVVPEEIRLSFNLIPNKVEGIIDSDVELYKSSYLKSNHNLRAPPIS